jgi:Fe-S cluster assembly scaffold protein SufB
VRFISAKKDEPQWMLEWRLDAYRRWLELEEPTWAKVNYPKIDYQDSYYYAAPKKKAGPKSLDEVDPDILAVYAKLGIPLKEQEVLAGVEGAPRYAVDAVFDSVSVVTTFKKELAKVGVIFCSMSEAIREHPDLVRQYLGSVVPVSDNYFACLNSAVFSDGSFVYIPPGVRCPMELSTYFRINAKDSGQFERTLIIADKGAYVLYLEGCTAPMRDENQLHAAVVELVLLDDAEIKYSTVQNWYPGDGTARAASTTSSPSAPTAAATAPSVAGPRSRPARPSPGNIRPACCAARELGRVLFDRRDQRPPAGRHRHQDDPSGQEHEVADRRQGHQRRQVGPAPIAAWSRPTPRPRARATSPSATAC